MKLSHYSLRVRFVGVCGLALAALLVASCRQAGRPPGVGGPVAGATTAPAAAPEYECRWAGGPITLDGKADEEAWGHAQAIDRFVLPVSLGGKAARAGTKARLLWDREYLYFFAEMQDRDLSAEITEHNGRLWTNDVFELFFKPADGRPGYYEFEVNAANATMELFLPSRDAGGYEKHKGAWDIEMKTAVALGGALNRHSGCDRGWAVEGRLRWRDFVPTGGRPEAGEAWNFALCRCDYTAGRKEPEYSSCAPLARVDFHRHEDYAKLRFVGPGAATAGGPYGIESRPLWTTSRVVGSPNPPSPYQAVKAFPDFKIMQPLYVRPEPGTNDLLLIQHLGSWAGPGRILRLKNDPAATAARTLFDADRIIYSLAFHPDYARNRYVYVCSNGPVKEDNKQDRVSRFTVSRDADGKLDPASEQVVLEWDSNGHNGGDMAFGPDGFLYVSTGDGTSDSDANLRGQDVTQLTSAMLRLDVDHPAGGHPTSDHPAGAAKNYSIPKDNPFVNLKGARPEIWAFGFRNPWRGLSFDRETGQLWIGQNGQDLWEQVYLVRKGENYGWSINEGSHPFNLTRKQGPGPIVPPAAEHSHSEFRSLTGGVVYYGDKLPELRGAYIYGDWSTGQIWGVRHDGTRVTWNQQLADTPMQITGFGVDQNGELLICDHGSGLYKLRRRPPEQAASRPQPFPTKLSETGLFASVPEHAPAPGLIPYSVNAPLWSDNAEKERFIALPGDAKIDYASNGGWNFPDGAVLVKTFALDMEVGNPASRRRIETRLLTRQRGQWRGYTYVWNEQQSEASLADAAGLDLPFTIRDAAAPAGRRQQTWHYPSRTECMVCHTRAANWVLGLSEVQMNRTHDYHGVRDNQLRVLEHLGVFRVNYLSRAMEQIKADALRRGVPDPQANDLMKKWGDANQRKEAVSSALLTYPPEALPHLADPYDASADLESRARSYLHGNCAHCHTSAGGGNALMELTYATARDKTNLYDVPPQHDAFGLPAARLVAPGSPDRSTLLHRVALRGAGQMPPLGTSLPDAGGVKMLREWIAAVKPAETGATR